MTPPQPASPRARIAFIGGGNMASAIIGGLVRQGEEPGRITVVEPLAAARERLAADFGLRPEAAPGPALHGSDLVVWAVKPQVFREAALAAAPHSAAALHLSVAAGIGSDSIAHWLGSERIVRAMPNTPALVGRGVTGLFARAAAGAADRALVDRVLEPTGARVWVEREAQLDAVTALSGSGPAYVFYFLEAMQQAGAELGLPPAQALELAMATFAGAAHLAAQSGEPPAVLRERVTSKGGTTFAAIGVLDAADVRNHFAAAIRAAHDRAQELGTEFGKG
ncbi:pyrroline-5-carboxylate reductase [Xylophilus sp.]|uniref:pyrroline-5-carboxylate reductase n=1 Tax=Xylophilus sp. TaxID=2653893 RepID=UPI0013BE7B05|nr:pyrroline-5-carboxylate reductase [Xylophilus sp.]KAF1046631.1 MAG: Pyrroline-5-carboxylate reductase [Xylophilus sp.]